VNDERRIAELENVLARFLQPVRDIPFPVVIKSIANCSVKPVDHANPDHRDLIAKLVETSGLVASYLQRNPIRRNRPNEVGNDIEPIVMACAEQVGLTVERPRAADGRGQQVGYPDILLRTDGGEIAYLECKIFGADNADTTMRSFYLSPSERPKVCYDALHTLLAFGMKRDAIPGSRDSYFTALSFKLVDLFGLKCDVKYEFNSDNRRLYADGLLLASGDLV
jgi:hypothetical protein